MAELGAELSIATSREMRLRIQPVPRWDRLANGLSSSVFCIPARARQMLKVRLEAGTLAGGPHQPLTVKSKYLMVRGTIANPEL